MCVAAKCVLGPVDILNGSGFNQEALVVSELGFVFEVEKLVSSGRRAGSVDCSTTARSGAVAERCSSMPFGVQSPVGS